MNNLSIKSLKNMHNLHIDTIKSVYSSISVPGSKSISNRALLLSSISNQNTKLYGLLDSDDTNIMLKALEILGVIIVKHDDFIEIYGDFSKFKVKKAELFMGNAGTAMRPLTAILSLMQGEYILKGIQRMHERPIKDLVEGLKSIGADIKYLEYNGYPPIQINPAYIDNNKKIILKANTSSQFLSSVLMALPILKSDKDLLIEIDGEIISRPYIDLTIKLMHQFGVKVIDNNNQFIIKAHSIYNSPKEFHIEGDASSASYMIACGLLGGELTIKNVGKNSIQGDVGFVQAARQMGANILLNDTSITAYKSTLHGGVIDCLLIPDAAMTLAILALFASSPTTLTNIASWKVKETDRIKAMHTELTKLGASIQSGDNFITINPPLRWLQPDGIDTYDDHRMAMCFALCAFSENLNGITINDPACIAKTYPTFFEDLYKIAEFGAETVENVEFTDASLDTVKEVFAKRKSAIAKVLKYLEDK